MAIIHLNVPNFVTSVATLVDSSLTEKPFVVAKESSVRPIVVALSPLAQQEGLFLGMPLSLAYRMLPSIKVILPNPTACAKLDSLLLEAASHFSPTVQTNSQGHLFLDMSGTSRLFGSPIDSAVRLRNHIQHQIGIDSSVAVASNKLVAKVGTRTIYPSGVTQIHSGDEASFLAQQDISLLPGLGQKSQTLLRVANFHQIGEVANLSDEQALTLLGKRGLSLRDASLGWDNSLVDPRNLTQRRVTKRIDFTEPAFELEMMRAALITAVEEAAFEMRKESLGCLSLHLELYWADGKRERGVYTFREPTIFDSQLIEASFLTLSKTLHRRVRLHSIALSLGNLTPYKGELELFNTIEMEKRKSLQKIADATRLRFGLHSLTKASTLYGK